MNNQLLNLESVFLEDFIKDTRLRIHHKFQNIFFFTLELVGYLIRVNCEENEDSKISLSFEFFGYQNPNQS